MFNPLGCRLCVGLPFGLVDRAEAGWEDDTAFEGLKWRISSIGVLVVGAAVDVPGSPPPGIPTIAPLLATFRYSRFITLCLGVVGELVGSSGTFRACGPVYVRIGRGRVGGWMRDAEEEEEADDAEVVEITDAFRESSALDGALTMIVAMGVDIHQVQPLTNFLRFSTNFPWSQGRASRGPSHSSSWLPTTSKVDQTISDTSPGRDADPRY